MRALLCDICLKRLDGLCLRLTVRGVVDLALGLEGRDVDLCEEHAAAPLAAINAAIAACESRRGRPKEIEA